MEAHGDGEWTIGSVGLGHKNTEDRVAVEFDYTGGYQQQKYREKKQYQVGFRVLRGRKVTRATSGLMMFLRVRSGVGAGGLSLLIGRRLEGVKA